MASTIALKRRITSIKNTRQITKAMQLVSASKMRRAQEAAYASRAYRTVAYSLLSHLNTVREVARQPLFRTRPVKTRLYVIITSNSGLAGAYNANVLKLLFRSIKADQDAGVASRVIAIGSKGAQFVRRLKDVDLVAVYSALGDNPTANDVRPVLNTMIDEYKDAVVDDVQILYTEFKSSITQVAQALQLLPAKTDEITEAKPAGVLNFEPDVETVIEQVTTRLIEAQLWQAMRMMAMKNATDNAKDLIDDYTLELNTARQASITQELAEITGGAEALNG
jgi:F-type H+-transporting ATPase subunit gamma